MYRWIGLSITLVASAAAVIAQPTASITAPEQYAGGFGVPELFVQQIFVAIPPGDDWTSSTLYLEMPGDYLYQDWAAGDENPPNINIFDHDPTWSSYYTSPGDWPNAPYDGTIVQMEYCNDSTSLLDAGWSDLIDTGAGEYLVAQISVLGEPGTQTVPATFTLTTAAHPEPMEFVFDVYLPVPEPGTGLLAIMTVLVLRRQR